MAKRRILIFWCWLLVIAGTTSANADCGSVAVTVTPGAPGQLSGYAVDATGIARTVDFVNVPGTSSYSANAPAPLNALLHAQWDFQNFPQIVKEVRCADSGWPAIAIDFPPTGRIGGQILTPAGVPVTTATVAVTYPDNRSPSITIKPYGPYAQFFVDNISPGVCLFTVTAPEYATSSQQMTIQQYQFIWSSPALTPYGWITGTVVAGTSRTPAAGKVVTLTGNGLTKTTTANATGAFRFDDLPAGTYTIKAVFGTNAVSETRAVQQGLETSVSLWYNLKYF